MISISLVFYLFVLLGAMIGMIRGWAKELLVTFSTVLAIFIILVFETYIGVFQEFLANDPIRTFWTRAGIILIFAFFGYQTPNIPRFENAMRREKLQDSLLGTILGGFNGYAVMGSIWYYLHTAGYPFIEHMSSPVSEKVLELVMKMPPEWIGIPGIYFVIAFAFTFIVMVFI